MQNRLALASILLTYSNPQGLSVLASIIAIIVAIDSLRVKVIVAGGVKQFLKNLLNWKKQ
jgi:hypothetical protein